jgi:hypothetical protein
MPRAVCCTVDKVTIIGLVASGNDVDDSCVPCMCDGCMCEVSKLVVHLPAPAASAYIFDRYELECVAGHCPPVVVQSLLFSFKHMKYVIS